MTSETDLSQAQLGERVLQFRSLRRMSLKELGEATGTTAGFLSQLERGLTNASIGVLRRIATALGMTLADLFEEVPAGSPRLLRREARPELSTNAGIHKFLISQRPLRHLEVYAGEFEPGASTGDEPYTHGDSQEILYVVSGQIVIELDGEPHSMQQGDSIDYMSSLPHRLTNTGTVSAEVLLDSQPANQHLAVHGCLFCCQGQQVDGAPVDAAPLLFDDGGRFRRRRLDFGVLVYPELLMWGFPECELQAIDLVQDWGSLFSEEDPRINVRAS